MLTIKRPSHARNLKGYAICRQFMLLLLCVASAHTVAAQQEMDWVDIHLLDTMAYVDFSVSKVNTPEYPPGNLFDAKQHSCWVCGQDTGEQIAFLYLELPSVDEPLINIFPGYGKSKKLFVENARPQTLRCVLYFAVNPDGYASQYGTQYKAIRFPNEQIIHLADSFDVQSVPLEFDKKDLTAFATKVREQYDRDFEMPAGQSCFVLQIEVVDTYSGTKYSDVCISEIFFNDCFVSFAPPTSSPVKKLYFNPDENTLLMDVCISDSIVAYSDTSSVLQLVDISLQKHWAILISMPAEIQGRVETTYLLLDLRKKKLVNTALEKYTGHYEWGVGMYFDSRKEGLLYMVYLDREGQYRKVLLR